MKSLIILLVSILTITIALEAQLFETLKREAVKQALDVESTSINFTQDEAAGAIKEALTKGISKGAEQVSKADGFLKNPEIKIPFPEDAKKVETTLRKAGMGKQVDQAVVSINRAAEMASKEAKEVFIQSIKDMSVKDAVKIIKGEDDAATSYLQENTSEELASRFKPIIKTSLEKTDATKNWNTVMKSYNKIPFVKKVNPDLTDYVTQKALDGLFIMIAKEELEIRKDPIARTTDLLKKVFGAK